MLRALLQIYGLLNGPERKKLYFLQLVIILSAALELASVSSVFPLAVVASDVSVIDNNKIVASIYSTLGFNSHETFLVFAGILFVSAITISNVFQIVSIYLQSKYAMNVGAGFSSKLFQYYLYQDISFHGENKDSVFINRAIIDSDRVSRDVLVPALRVNAKLFSIIFISLIIFISDATLAVTAFLVLTASYLCVIKVTRIYGVKNSLAITKENDKRVNCLTESFSGIRDIKVAGVEDRFNTLYSDSTVKSTQANANNIILGAAPYYVLEIVALSGISAVALYLMITTDGLGESLPALAFYAMAGYKLLPSFQQAYNAFNTFRSAKASFDNIYPDLKRAVSFYAPVSKYEPLEIKASIRLENISYSYKNRGIWALRDVSLEFPVGTCTAIVGESGSGKSTLVDILLGFLVPDAGAIYIDDKQLSREDAPALRQMICYVPQNIHLMDHSIVENISFYSADGNFDIEKVRDACTKVSLDTFVEALPDSYHTPVGEKGSLLSGGQRQRISIARAIYSGRDVLIFDEPTSAVDEVGIREIMESIRSLLPEKTVIIVTHSGLVCDYVDRVYDLEKSTLIKV